MAVGRLRVFLVSPCACWAKKVKSEGAFSKGQTRHPHHLSFLCRPTLLQCLCGPTSDEEDKRCRPPEGLEGCRKPSGPLMGSKARFRSRPTPSGEAEAGDMKTPRRLRPGGQNEATWGIRTIRGADVLKESNDRL